MVKCKILFDNNPDGVYFNGQQVTGKVKITLLKKKEIQAIILNLSGRAKTKWPENDESNEGYEWFQGKEEYFDVTKFLVGLPGAEKKLTLEPRVHTFDFSYTLPSTIPSSFEGEFGYIRYLVKVTLKRPWKFDQEYVAGFTVLKAVNLNCEQPEIKLPFEIINSRELKEGFLKSPTCSVSIRLPQMGFVPGQVMPVTLNIQNDSTIKYCQIKFNQVVTSKMLNDTNYVVNKNCLYKKKYGLIQKCTKNTILQDIRVPSVPPTCKNSCSIITINYEIEAVINFGWLHKEFNVCCPVIIGTFPVIAVVTRQEGTSDINPNINQPNLHYSSKIGPFLYETAAKMNRVIVSNEVEHPIKKSKFLPRYPVYKFYD